MGGKKGGKRTGGQAGAKSPRKVRRPGLPKGTVVSTKTFVSPKGRRYRVMRTTERDAYDEPEKPRGKS